MPIKTFTAGSVLTASDTNTYLANAGLVYVTAQTVTANTTMDIKQCFTSTYDYYRITGYFSSAATSYLRLQLIDGATPTVRNAISYFTAGFQCLATSGGLNYANDNGTSYANIFITQFASNAQFTMDFSYQPSGYSTWTTMGTSIGNANVEHRSGGYHTTVAHDGIRLFSGGNMTGTVRVYGYRKA